VSVAENAAVRVAHPNCEPGGMDLEYVADRYGDFDGPAVGSRLGPPAELELAFPLDSVLLAHGDLGATVSSEGNARTGR
jgi:hypothetical protein